MDNVVLISQNVKLSSLDKLKSVLAGETELTVLSTQFLFENERELIDNIFEINCKYLTFADLLNDQERENCDKNAFCLEKQGQDVFAYYEDIKIQKNKLIVGKLLSRGTYKNKIIVCDDLGIYKPIWIEYGFVPVDCDYYYVPSVKKEGSAVKLIKKALRFLYVPCFRIKSEFETKIFVAYKDGVKYLFYGALNRIGYRLNLDFKPASKIENILYILKTII